MTIIGIMMLVIGTILLISAAAIYKNARKATEEYKDMPGDNDNFLMLLSNGMIVLRIIGVILIGIGCLFLFVDLT